MLFTRRTQIAFDAGQTKSSWSSTRVTPSRCRPLLMHYETARFHLFCAKVDRSVAPICALPRIYDSRSDERRSGSTANRI
jgi:hypothetical protein